jgi:hypothetical protein
MLNENLKKLIDSILAKTKARKLKWLETSGEEEFKLNLNSGSVFVNSWFDDFTGEENIRIEIYNEGNRKIENYTISESNGSHEYQLLSDLHSEVKRSFFKVEETYKGMLEELGNEEIVGNDEKQDNAGSSYDDDDIPF